jgi:helix-turn-helix protein
MSRPRVASPLSPGVFFRALRTFKGWSREEVARRAQMSPGRVARIEAGAVPTAEELGGLWRTFGGSSGRVESPLLTPEEAPR